MEVLAEKGDPDSLRYCIESTGTYHLPVLQAWRGQPSVVNPLLAGATRRKTDVLDAQLLAYHSLTGVWRTSFIPSEDCQQLRVLWAQRADAARVATRVSNRINNILLRFGHTFGADFRMRSAQAEGLIDDLCHGRLPNSGGVCPHGLPSAMQDTISGLYVQMKQAMNEAVRAQAVAVNFVKLRDWPIEVGNVTGTTLLALLQTVPGVGIGTAMSWLAEVGDPKRFQNPKQVAAFSGCDPSLKVSAGKVTSHTRRAGNMRLHQALVYAAQAVMQRGKTALAQWGRSIAGRHKKGGYRKATGAVARRIACSLWHVHRLAQNYDESKYDFYTQPVVPDLPLKEVLPSRYCSILTAAKVTSTAQLAEAYQKGELAKICGFGDKAFQLVRDWIARHAAVSRKRGKPYALKTGADELKYTKGKPCRKSKTAAVQK